MEAVHSTEAIGHLNFTMYCLSDYRALNWTALAFTNHCTNISTCQTGGWMC